MPGEQQGATTSDTTPCPAMGPRPRALEGLVAHVALCWLHSPGALCVPGTLSFIPVYCVCAAHVYYCTWRDEDSVQTATGRGVEGGRGRHTRRGRGRGQRARAGWMAGCWLAGKQQQFEPQRCCVCTCSRCNGRVVAPGSHKRAAVGASAGEKGGGGRGGEGRGAWCRSKRSRQETPRTTHHAPRTTHHTTGAAVLGCWPWQTSSGIVASGAPRAPAPAPAPAPAATENKRKGTFPHSQDGLARVQ